MSYIKHEGDPETWIPKDQLQIGWYKGKCRNSSVAKWDGKVFHYIRSKFGAHYTESIPHPEDDIGFDVFFPQEYISL